MQTELIEWLGDVRLSYDCGDAIAQCFWLIEQYPGGST
jgi:hypothetical protein